MKFEEIFNEPGLYKADSFMKGVVFEITKDLKLYLVVYRDKDDLLPTKETMCVGADLFKKEYKKVFTRQNLFD